MRRVDCPRCGVKVERVPWADGKGRLTTEYKWFLAGWARRMSWKEVAGCFAVSWDHFYNSVKFAVSWGFLHRNLDGYEPALKGCRWLLLKRPANMTENQTIRLKELLQYNLQSVRSHLMKEDFQQFWNYTSPVWAGKFLDAWCTRAMRSKIEPKKLTKPRYTITLETSRNRNSPTDSSREANKGIVLQGATSEGCTNIYYSLLVYTSIAMTDGFNGDLTIKFKRTCRFRRLSD